MRRPNFYSGARIDRADHLRADEGWLQARLGDSSSRFVAVWRSKNLVISADRPRAAWLGAEQASVLLRDARFLTFLGLHEERSYFALDLSHLDDPKEEPALATLGEFQDLRAVGPVLRRDEGSLLAYARGLMHWHRRHLFCGLCGGRTESSRAGHLRVCTNSGCGSQHFPRTDPAVIMLVHDGGGRCVLGRQSIWPQGMHSTLAGFVEPGESLEEAVAREVKEEVGLEIDPADVSYHSSQPWPFPSSIMLGFHARVGFAPLAVNAEEMEDAAWYSRDDLANSPEDERFRLPRRDSIAWRLIEDWLAEKG